MSGFNQFELRATTTVALDAMGIHTPTPIQQQAIPPLLQERDVIGQARTGSGKTLAFAIPLVEFITPREPHVQALVLCPTRELAVQVGSVIDAIGKPAGIKTVLAFGGRAIGPQAEALRRGAQVVVGAPGRVLDLMQRGDLDLRHVHYFVLDEADEMLDRGFAPAVERIMGKLPRKRQTALFSATVPPWVLQTCEQHLRAPVRVQLDTEPREQPDIEHRVFQVDATPKLEVLQQLLDGRGPGSIIVFGRTKHGVKKLAKQLEAKGYPVAALQGNLSQNARDRVMAEFRDGGVPILLATNVAARGLDVDHVDLVINYELPETAELLTHRVGRTGRAGRKGVAVTLLGPEDGDKWRQLQKGMKQRLTTTPWAAESGTTPPAGGDRPQPPSARAGQAPRDPADPQRQAQAPRPQANAPRHAQGPRPQADAPRQAQGPRPQANAPRHAQGPRPQGDAPRHAQGPRPQPSAAPQGGSSRTAGQPGGEGRLGTSSGGARRQTGGPRRP
ncbi:MAG: DEAD/DEAH box helicase [Candidatus Sericytochromatia bacterium]|nr:DEAD/DEAH box helicase [Candidatus Sericytochromatia bacterium]